VTEFEQILHHIAGGTLDVSGLVTDHAALSAMPEAFERLGRPGEDAKILVSPWLEEETP